MHLRSRGELKLQGRDLDLLRGLFESRVMTPAHIATLFFSGKAEYCKKRLQVLKAASLITAKRPTRFQPSLIFLASKGIAVLRDKGVLNDYPHLPASALEKRTQVSDLTLNHELEVMDVKVAFHEALASVQRIKLEQFTTWPRLNEFEVPNPANPARDVLVKPDAYIEITEAEPEGESVHSYFLELDRSTESQDTLIERAQSYVAYYRSGGFAQRNGGTPADFAEFPFLVLLVCPNDERRNNTAERLLQITPPIMRQVYLTTLPEVTTDPLGAIWIRPIDYQVVTKGTRFDPAQRQPSRYYARQSEREALVAKSIVKCRLLEDTR